MGPVLLRRWGIVFVIMGVTVIVTSIYVSCIFNMTVLTEVLPGVATIYLGMYLISVGTKQSDKQQQLPEESPDSGRASPFYYELEPSLTLQRALPPIPKDIGREYDPVVLDKV